VHKTSPVDIVKLNSPMEAPLIFELSSGPQPTGHRLPKGVDKGQIAVKEGGIWELRAQRPRCNT
jgi:hypothetical protein